MMRLKKMSYKPPKLTDKRKLCPRCGSPLMDMGNFLKCPLCGYSKLHEGEEPRVAIKYAETEVSKKGKEVKMYQVTTSGIVPSNALEKTGVFLITDPGKNTIWLWKGSEARPKTVYDAGTAATKLKTTEKLYSSKLFIKKITIIKK